nr:glycosyltransferase [Candidatus Saccharibacteria bacterium]
VVATNVDGAREAIIDGKNGFLIEPDDLNRMAERVVWLIRNREQAQKMGQEGRKTLYPAFDIDCMVKEIESLYSG